MPSLGSLLPPRRRLLPGVTVAVLGTGAVAAGLLPFRGDLDAGAAGLAFVVPVVIATALGGATASVVAVLVGFLVFNYLFTRPYHTFEVAHAPDLVALTVYVLVGAVTAAIVSLRQREADVARRRETEAVTVFDLSRALLSEVGVDAVLASVVRGASRLDDVRGAAVFVAADGSSLRLAAAAGEPLPTGVAEALTERGSAAAAGASLREHDVQVFSLPAGGSVRGVLVVLGAVPDGARRVLATFAHQAAVALHRAELAISATRVEVLEAADEIRAALIRSVSHDLRTPLAAMTAAAEDLADPDLRLPAGDRRLLAVTVAEEAARLDRLVGNLLDMSRLEAGRLELRPEAVDLSELVEAAAGRDRPIEAELAAGLPPAHVDPLLIEQALRNLFDNAVVHGGAATVEVTGRGVGDVIELRVIDHGPGIPAAERERIFDLFLRVADPDAHPQGTGLGLAICRGYVEAHGGTVRLEDTPGGGATFTVTLPTTRDLPEDATPVGGRS